MAEKIDFVQLESPFGAQTADAVAENIAYAYAAMRDSLYRAEAPFASHLLYTQMLNDWDAVERDMGITAGLAIGEFATRTVVYEDLGISRGMQMGVGHALELGRPVEYRRLFPQNATRAEIIGAIATNSPLPLDVIRRVYAPNL